jgi:arginyl-tRNA synthetase
MREGIRALGIKEERLKILITQLVRLVSGGKEVRMSKRKGEFVTMDDLLEEVGADAARFFFLMHSLDTHMDFDLDLAKERSQKNPVFYAQYALVRCANILAKSEKRKAKNNNLDLLNSDSEIKLMLELVKLPDVIAQTAKDYQVHRLTKYATDIAKALHNFYEKERVIGIENVKLGQARLALVAATKVVLENIFDILGISKPEKM